MSDQFSGGPIRFSQNSIECFVAPVSPTRHRVVLIRVEINREPQAWIIGLNSKDRDPSVANFLSDDKRASSAQK
jgi:hypothetical protein